MRKSNMLSTSDLSGFYFFFSLFISPSLEDDLPESSCSNM